MMASGLVLAVGNVYVQLRYRKCAPISDAMARPSRCFSSKKIRAGRSKGISSRVLGGRELCEHVYTGKVVD
jgi:hypothetical protein